MAQHFHLFTLYLLLVKMMDVKRQLQLIAGPEGQQLGSLT